MQRRLCISHVPGVQTSQSTEKLGHRSSCAHVRGLVQSCAKTPMLLFQAAHGCSSGRRPGVVGSGSDHESREVPIEVIQVTPSSNPLQQGWASLGCCQVTNIYK